MNFAKTSILRLAVLSLETSPLRDRREDIPAMVALFLHEAADAIPELAAMNEPYRIQEDALALLCEFEYPGNVRTLRNLIYELTSYVEKDEPISVQLVQLGLAKLNRRVSNQVTSTDDWLQDDAVSVSGAISSANVSSMSSAALHVFLRSLANEGDIILPFELCVLRRGETFKQWTARAKRCGIEAACQATGGTMQRVAERLGLTRSSLMGHFNRAKQTQTEVLFDWKSEPD